MSLDRAFLQQLILLLLTALISGLGIPYVMKVVEDRKLRRQKQFEADLSRQSRLIDAQAKLLDDLTELLWKWRYLAKSVVYYRSRNDRERFEGARKEYEQVVWGLLNQFRTEISRSRRLVSESAFQRLDALYDYVVHDLDLKISDLMSQDGPQCQQECRKMADRFTTEVSQKLDQALDDLAAELHLKIKAETR